MTVSSCCSGGHQTQLKVKALPFKTVPVITTQAAYTPLIYTPVINNSPPAINLFTGTGSLLSTIG